MFKDRKKFRKHILLKNDEIKIKIKREKLRKQTEFYLNVEYKFISKNDLEKNAN